MRENEPREYRRREVYTCVCCDEPIFEGDDYYEIPGFGTVCEKCIEDAHYCSAESEHACYYSAGR